MIQLFLNSLAWINIVTVCCCCVIDVPCTQSFRLLFPVIHCPPPPTVTHGEVVQSGNTIGSTTTYSCTTNHYLPGGGRFRVLVCHLKAGGATWGSDKPITCQGKC